MNTPFAHAWTRTRFKGGCIASSQASEKLVQETIDNLGWNEGNNASLTVLIIAHRLSTVPWGTPGQKDCIAFGQIRWETRQKTFRELRLVGFEETLNTPGARYAACLLSFACPVRLPRPLAACR